MQELTDLERRQAEEIGKLKRGQEILKTQCKKQSEELQKQETQIELLTDQVERMSEDGENSICVDSQRDERDLEIADKLDELQLALHKEGYIATDEIVHRIDIITKKLRGE